MKRHEAAKNLTTAAAEHRTAGRVGPAILLEDAVVEMTLGRRPAAGLIEWAKGCVRAPEIWPAGYIEAKALLVETFEVLED